MGFLQDLPETLVTAFAATLDELADADLLVHVIDCANSAFEAQMEAVEKLLEDLGLGQTPILRVFNKKDLIASETAENLSDRYNGVAISAIDTKSFPPLIRRMEEEILMTPSESVHAENDSQATPYPGSC